MPVLVMGTGFAASVQQFPGTLASGYQSLLFKGDTLWMGTAGGLRWMDTVTSKSGWITSADGIPSNHIIGIALDRDSNLAVGVRQSTGDFRGWIGHRSKEGVWSVDSVSDQPVYGATAFSVASDGTEWFLHSMKLFKKAAGQSKWSFIDHGGTFPVPLRLVYAEPEGSRIWYISDLRLCRQEDGLDTRPYCYPEVYDGKTFGGRPLVSVGGGGKWPLYAMNIAGMIYRWDRSRDAFDSVSAVLNGTRLIVGQDGSLWVGTNSRGLFRVEIGKPPMEVLPGDRSYSVLVEDREGNIWVGGQYESQILRIDHSTKSVRMFALPIGHPGERGSFGFAEDPNGVVWLGSSYFDGKKWVHVPSMGEGPWYSPDGFRFSIHIVPGGGLDESHVDIFDGQQIRHYEGIQAESFLALEKGKVLAQKGQKFSIWDNPTWKPWVKPDSVPMFQLTNMTRRADGAWVSGQFAEGGKVPVVRPDGTSATEPIALGRTAASVAIDDFGSYWMGYGDSLWVDAGTSWRGISLPNDLHDIFRISFDPEGGIWVEPTVSTSIAGHQICRLLNGQWFCLGERNGYPGASVLPFRDSHGDLWLGMANYGCARQIAPTSQRFYDSLQLWPEYPYPRGSSALGERKLAKGTRGIHLRWIEKGMKAPAQTSLYQPDGQPVRLDRGEVSRNGVYVVVPNAPAN